MFKTLILNLKFLTGHLVSNFIPEVFNRLHHNSQKFENALVKKNSDIVIEGFPRCANTYSTIAFILAQNDKNIKIAHHIHKISQVKLAKKYKIPCIVVIREPRACLSSFKVRQPKYYSLTLLLGYYLFHRELNKLKDCVFVVDFKDVISRFDLVTQELNQYYSTNFNIYTKTDENETQIESLIRQKKDVKARPNGELRLAYPSKEKKELSTKFNQQLFHGKLNSILIKRCERIYCNLSN